jgi:exodeoxyribonuclease VII small subunit
MNETPSFESAVAELEKILRTLEDGSTSLEEGLAQYERGVTLLKLCYAQLQAAEHRISILAGLDGDGKPVLEPFNHAASDGPRDDAPRPPASPRVGPTRQRGLRP